MEVKKLFSAILIFGLTSCATPSQHFNQVASKQGLYGQIIRGKSFQHKIYSTPDIKEGKTLHVYLDGDGTPWERKRWISEDPTSRNPLILRLMTQDKMPSILLGRPCYYGLSQEDECHFKYWTSDRYSEKVVNSMANVLNQWVTNRQFNELVLIGYSGGGSLAVLMADKVQKIKKIVTIAANLNVGAWSQFHGYQTLKHSLDPSKQVSLKEDIIQLHFAGLDDEVVPAYIIKNYALSQKNAKYYEFIDNDHTCCWEKVWSKVLRIIKQ